MADHQTTTPDELRALQDLLSEALDLCLRARKLDDAHLALNEWHARNPHATRSGTIPLWVAEQYECDLAEWETRAKSALRARLAMEDGA